MSKRATITNLKQLNAINIITAIIHPVIPVFIKRMYKFLRVRFGGRRARIRNVCEADAYDEKFFNINFISDCIEYGKVRRLPVLYNFVRFLLYRIDMGRIRAFCLRRPVKMCRRCRQSQFIFIYLRDFINCHFYF